jgi:hypothetical protein
MPARRTVTIVVCGALGLSAIPAASQTSKLNRLPPARAPCTVLSGHPCHPSFCGGFHHGPCFPYYEPPFGQTLQLTIVSTDDSDPSNKDGGDKSDADASGKSTAADSASDDHTLDTIGDMFTALRACWVPPPKDAARHGMQYTIRFAFKRDGEMIAPPRMTYASHDASTDLRNIYRDAIDAALKRCTPLHFSEGMGGAVAGRPIAIRFVDDRTIVNDSAK